MIRFLGFAVFFLSLLTVRAGSADAVIRGKTESGRTEIEILVGDIDGLVRSVALTIDGESYRISEDEMTFQSVVRDQANGVYFLVLNAGAKEFRLWMIPDSEKVLEKDENSYRSRFGAVLEATDPRETDGSLTPRITIGCSLDYEI
ncbi:MAG: hypothetical protein Q7Q71_13030 [Verrucomicrobiota bacterium JB023]|nr:hypothetical protein [Verrucomicrobiota bacterium JB023]